MPYKKKLIEVALPLEAINNACAYEKMPGIGPHPRGIHLWWARRPLAAARAVIWASLVDDPSSLPKEFPTEEAQNRERERLFGILEQLVKWENSNNQDVLNAAKAEIMKSTNGKPPPLLDPFAGGGAIPLEAQRLGLEAHASDLNPVAVMINKAMIELPPKFVNQRPVNPKARTDLADDKTWTGTQGLAEDVRYYGEWMKKKAFEMIGHLYPKVKDENGKEHTVIAWIWARTVASPNPIARGAHVPLVSSFMLSTKKGNKAWVEIVDDPSAKDGWRFEVKTGILPKQLEESKMLGTKAGKAKDFICHLTNSPIQRSYIQSEGKAGRLSKRLMAMVVVGTSGRIYISPCQFHQDMAISEDDSPDVRFAQETFLSGNTPTRAMITGGVCSAYGLKTWGHIFTSRQLVALTTFSSLVAEAQEQIVADGGSKDYAQTIGVYLAFAIDRTADFSTSISRWAATNEKAMNLFSKQAIPMTWDYPEVNVMADSVGSFTTITDFIARCIATLPIIGEQGFVIQQDAQTDNGLRNIMVSTDPPYYDNIGYADLSDFFYVWLRQSLKEIYPQLFFTMLVPKAEELVATPYRFKDGRSEARGFFEKGMAQAFRLINAYARDDVPTTVYYGYKQSDNEGERTSSTGWETMLSAIIHAGFTITGTWPMRSEQAYRAISMNTNALASSIVLVCRKRPADAPNSSRRDFINTLKRELRPALQKLQASNIAPVDLAQSAIGPGMGVYSRFSNVLEADGTPMGVRAALQIINQELDLYITEQDDELDRDSRFCVVLYTQYAFNNVKFGEADVLARAMNTSVEKLAARKILQAQKGVVRLLGRGEIPEKIESHEQIIWLLAQQLTHAIEKDGIVGAAKIVANILTSEPEQAKTLAYRLFTIAERKGWAQEAFAYNSLVISWPDVQSKAADLQGHGSRAEQLHLDFGG